MLNATLNEWQRANKTTMEKSINVFFKSVFELDVDWLLLQLADSVFVVVLCFLIDFLFSENFFNDDIILQFKNVKTDKGKTAVNVKLDTIMYQNT